MKLALSFAISTVLLATFSEAALAKDKSLTRDAREKVARKACITGDFHKGVDILADLFIETRDYTYVFNQGRCFQQNHHWQESLDSFTEYLRKATGISSDEVAEVQKYIADCKSHLSPPQSDPAAAPALPLPPPSPAAQPQPGSTMGTAAASTAATAPPLVATHDAHTGSGLRVAGIVVGAVGVAAVAAGALMSMKTHSLVDDMYSNGFDPNKESSRKTYETMGWVSFGVGAAAIVAGATVYYLGWSAARSGSAETNISLVPVFGPDRAMLVFQRGIQ
jgi:hypothetical protein